jgi:hypothetical protein
MQYRKAPEQDHEYEHKTNGNMSLYVHEYEHEPVQTHIHTWCDWNQMRWARYLQHGSR